LETCATPSSFVIRASSFLRHLTFVIRHFPPPLSLLPALAYNSRRERRWVRL
jgi:hypothetical protein